jgi:hypothetical protein
VEYGAVDANWADGAWTSKVSASYGSLATWGHVMREYHFYFLDQHSQIQSTKIAQCADDVAALEFAQQLKAPADIEVWHGTHLVTRLNAKGDSVPNERGVNAVRRA